MKRLIIFTMAILSLPLAIIGFISGFIAEYFMQGFRDGRRCEKTVEKWLFELSRIRK
jgi:hypothetical protein